MERAERGEARQKGKLESSRIENEIVQQEDEGRKVRRGA